MVDGDPQQRSELKNSITVYMSNAINGGCRWHIMEEGLKVHGSVKTAVKERDGKRDQYNLFKKRVKEWCYSWMTPGQAECKDEYCVSKKLLFSYLASSEALDVCDGQKYVIAQVSDFVCNYVIVYDQVFLFYKI
jgi:hypothetical protein